MLRLATVACLFLMLGAGGCKSTNGLGAHVDQKTAIRLARESTPLRDVRGVRGSFELPFRHVITGLDEDGRTLVVWVKTEVTQYVFLDEVISQDHAIAVAERLNISSASIRRVYLDHLIGQEQTVFWFVGNDRRYVWIRADTGDPLKVGEYGP